VFSHVCTKKIDFARKHRGRYNDRRFVYNAVKKFDEINAPHGEVKYTAIKNVKFSCTVTDDNENMFRPAIYPISNYCPDDSDSDLPVEQIPYRIASMIGYYRNVARKGDKVNVSGTLEKVEKLESGDVYYQVVVGTATQEREYIEPA